MRKFLLLAAGVAALTAGGVAIAQEHGPGHRGLFQHDSNGDGAVTRQEFDAAHAAMFAQRDTNNDGQLARGEGRGERGMRHGGMRGRGMRNADANNDGNVTREEFLAGPNAMFDRIDANHDGVLQASERPQRDARRAGREGRQEGRAGRARVDANNDGQISREEHAAMGAAMFERLDANNDGRVTREEAEAARGRHRQTQSQ